MKKRILLIDDEAGLREEVTEWLTLEDYEVECAANGLEGISLAFRTTPDLVICDISMPEMDGYGVLLELRANPATTTVPFIFVTARVSHEDIRQGMALGADDYITKPFTLTELLQAVESRLAKKADQEQQQQQVVEQWKQAFENEREQRLLIAKLIAMFSHDFRNPLAIIASSVSMVRDYADRIDEDRRQKHLNRALSSVNQLTQLLDDLFVISQMDTGHLTCEPESLNVTAFVQQIVDNFQSIHSDNHTLLFQSNISGRVMLDSRLLHQIVSNLIANALKYSPNGGRVWVNMALEHQDFMLTVRDEGIGIPEPEQAKLFNVFQRASNVGAIAGTGLGLAIVKQAIELQRGTVYLESQLGVGTHVAVKIPCAAQMEASQT